MKRAAPAILAAGALTLACLAQLGTQARAATVSPLPRADYGIRSVCGAPTPGRAKCLALELRPITAAARAHSHPIGLSGPGPIKAGLASDGVYGNRPTDLRNAYFPEDLPEAPAGDPQTIALVDAYDDPRAEYDLEVYDHEFGLPVCTAASGCLLKINQQGETSKLPVTTQETKRIAGEWAVETSTDIEIAHAICQTCHILLAEANSESFSDLEAAEEAAAKRGATEISNSWGGEEPSADNAAFNPSGSAEHPQPVITASSGDSGYLNWTEAEEAQAAEEAGEEVSYFVGADYPASSPHVVAVGGTALTLSQANSKWQSERVWNDDPLPEGGNDGASGGGCSLRFTAPAWQLATASWSSVGCEGRRAVADISADADPYTGVAVYDDVRDGAEETPGWITIGGTSVASPIIAGMYALAGGTHGIELAGGTQEEVSHPAEVLYSHVGASALHDITAGGNGECDGDYSEGCLGSISSAFDCGALLTICNAHIGYDGPTGVGTPNGIAAFLPDGSGKQSGEEQGKGGEKEGAGEEEAEGEVKPEGEKEAKREGEAKEGTSKDSESSGSPSGSSTTGTSSTSEDPSSGEEAGEEAGEESSGSQNAARIASTITLSKLRLIRSALEALHRGTPSVSKLRFGFTLSAAAHVRVTLYRRVGIGASAHWERIPSSKTLAARKGQNRDRLTSKELLTPGRYRLRLTPSGGHPHSVLFTFA